MVERRKDWKAARAVTTKGRSREIFLRVSQAPHRADYLKGRVDRYLDTEAFQTVL